MTQATETKYQLSSEDYKKLKQLLGHKPKPLEMVLALALWNEHCSYRSSKVHLKQFQFSTTKKVSALGEQAGVVDLGLGERVSFKMESHNHPSFIVPYHGASTGVGGILRDIFAMNAEPIALANYLCFGEPQAKGNAYRVDEVIRGIGDYGNCVGVPTMTGQTEFFSSYNGNILVNAMALGLLDSRTKAMDSKAKGVGNYVIYAGASTGRDGILGASMASQSFAEEESMSETKTTIQIGDPFFGRQLMEACLIAMKQKLVVSCQDMGAAGLTCSTFEMASKGKLGLSLHLDKVPLRDESLTVEDILLSESQERMLFLCEPKKWKKLEALFKARELEVCILGEVLKQQDIELFWKGRQILKVNPQVFTNQAPVENRPYVMPKSQERVSVEQFIPKVPQKSIKKLLLDFLSSPQGQSRKFVYSQYDQRVGTKTLKDASYPIAVLKLPKSERELGITMGCRPYLMELDVEQGAKDAVFYPALQLALRGFKPWAVTNCLNFGTPEKKEIMGEFVSSVKNLGEACKVLDIPVVSGNVSFYNETSGIDITPTPSIAMIGLKKNLRDSEKRKNQTFKKSLPDSGFQKRDERVYLLSSHQFWFQGVIRDFLPAGERSHQVYGGLQDPLVNLFIEQIQEISKGVKLSSARLVGRLGVTYTLVRMVLKNKVGFKLRKDFPFSLWQERLYEVIVSVEKAEEENLKTKARDIDLTFMGKTLPSEDLFLQGEKITYKQMHTQYFKPWSGDISL